MQCYRYLASTLTIENALEAIPGVPKKLPPNVVADWMEENRIDGEDLFLVPGDEIRATVEPLVHQNQPKILHAA